MEPRSDGFQGSEYGMSRQGADMNSRWRVVLTGSLLLCLTVTSFVPAGAASEKGSVRKREDGKAPALAKVAVPPEASSAAAAAASSLFAGGKVENDLASAP